MIATSKGMRRDVSILLLMIVWLAGCGSDGADDPGAEGKPKPVAKTNAMKVYMHYMPWFQSKPVSGYWGSHWRMSNKNPDNVDADGKREIASHYYPLIGPYDSKDADVIEYHLLLMKYAGVDGLIIDWYGSHNVYDYRVNLNGTNALIDRTDETGLQFAIAYEDYTAENVEKQTSKTAMEAATADMEYMEANYFANEQYIRIDEKPLLLTFGPRFFKSPAQWTQMFSTLGEKPKFLPLWGHAGYTGDNDAGEFAWVDFSASLETIDNFYLKDVYYDVLIGSAYPRFHDFYEEGGTGTSYGYVDFNNGATLETTLAKAGTAGIDYLQLVTWNDFGEGTVIEPTLEDGFKCLEILQEFTGVAYTVEELDLVHQYYLQKKKYQGDTVAEATLLKVFHHLTALEVEQARTLLEELP